MDRTAVSGTAGTGSIPVGGARRSYPLCSWLRTGPRCEAPAELAEQRGTHLALCGSPRSECKLPYEDAIDE